MSLDSIFNRSGEDKKQVMIWDLRKELHIVQQQYGIYRGTYPAHKLNKSRHRNKIAQFEKQIKELKTKLTLLGGLPNVNQ